MLITLTQHSGHGKRWLQHVATQGLRALDHTANAGRVGVGAWLSSLRKIPPQIICTSYYSSSLDFKVGHYMAV